MTPEQALAVLKHGCEKEIEEFCIGDAERTKAYAEMNEALNVLRPPQGDETMTDTTTTTLTVEQQQRAEALDKARAALAAKSFAGSSVAEPADLVSVAEWILTGNDPWVDIIADAAEKAAEPIAETIKTIIGNERVQCTSTHQETSGGKTHRCLLPKGHLGMHNDPTGDPARWVG